MGSVGNPNPWTPYYTTYKDCSQGICSIYCPQWCYIIFPPPPPSNDDSSTDFSPLIIAVIGILASAFILLTYYTLISKYCRRPTNQTNLELDDNLDHINNEPLSASSRGLDEALIKSITVCKYKRGEGLIEETDCSVCLSEFQENESLRLLPKCNHAFHLPCIDTWLKSQSSCPLCRSNIAPLQETQIPRGLNASALEHQISIDSVLVVQDLESIEIQACTESLQSSEQGNNNNGVVEIRDDGFQRFRRSVSLNSCDNQGRVCVADILRVREDDDDDDEQGKLEMGIGEEQGKLNNRSGVFNLGLKRSISTGRFVFARYGKGNSSSIIPH